MEELPGADAFPVDLSAIISNFYSRAGMVCAEQRADRICNIHRNSIPAGGNLKEPVTESTKKVARCFYALSQNRADSKRYPAVDPVDSYSKYLEYPEIIGYLDETVVNGWTDKVNKVKTLILRGKEAFEQINILGDDGVPIEYHKRFWRSELIDFVILQQDAFDKIDALTPMDRQQYMLTKVLEVCDLEFDFDNFEECSQFYKEIINFMRQMNYSTFEGEDFNNYLGQLNTFISNDK